MGAAPSSAAKCCWNKVEEATFQEWNAFGFGPPTPLRDPGVLAMVPGQR